METTIATGTDREGLRWTVTRWDENGLTEHYLTLGTGLFGGKSIVLNDMLVAALEKLPELD